MTHDEAILEQNTALDNIKGLLKLKDLRLGELEHYIGAQRGYFSRCKANNVEISFPKMLMVADFLGVTLEDLTDPNTLPDIELKAIDERIAELEKRKSELLGKRDDGKELWELFDNGETV